ncbi:extracellular solute-binding protein [Paenibacillus cymbidii]|uniref:extracellular solute-binding protein n=1 Tax=Paenibacillus cymbidii TaxID=1639034 RepID=UPI001436A71B|nr:extracellular solute-binding protein [Paenibacillus cymbidii]
MKRNSEFIYLTIAGEIRQSILDGTIEPGKFLMSEAELCDYYHTSRFSVRKALELLQNEGLIAKKAGQGSIVNPLLSPNEGHERVLRIVSSSPLHYLDYAMPVILEECRKRYPHMSVKLLRLSIQDFWQSVATSDEMGFKSDLFLLSDNQYRFARNQTGMFADLRPLLPPSYLTMYPKLLHAYEESGETLAVPVNVASVFMLVNPRLFDKYNVKLPNESWTTEDFIRAAQKLTVDTNSDGILDQYGFFLPSSISRWPVIALQQQVNFHRMDSSEPFLRTLDFIHDSLYRYRIAKLYKPTDYVISSHPFVNEKAAMLLTTTPEMIGLRRHGLPFEPLMADLPFGDIQSTLLSSNVFMAHSQSPNFDMASLFLQTALDPAVQERIARQAGFHSVYRSVNNRVWEERYLEKLLLSDDRIAGNQYIHEMVPDREILNVLDTQMESFWAGLEKADHFADKIVNMYKRQHATVE